MCDLPLHRPALFFLPGAALAAWLFFPTASPRAGEQDRQMYFLGKQSEAQDQEAEQTDEIPEEDRAKRAQGDANFDAIMTQNAPVAPAPMAGQAEILRRPYPQQANEQGMQEMLPRAAPAQAGDPPVVVPLKVFSQLRDRLNQIREETVKRQPPSVVLGAADYQGEARHGALALNLKLQVTLGRAERWKVVPLVGDGAVLVKAAVDGQPIPVSSQNGYHVWVTQRTGEAAVNLDLLVPSRGPRGSIEYDFLVARTPVTRFSCRFPVAGLEPKLDAAIQATVKPEASGTLLVAALQPTTRIHLVGFREMGEGEGQKAKVYAESLNLLSLDEGALDLFTVLRYTILYAGTKEFNIVVPPNLTVVAADGEGAFRFVIEKTDRGSLIKGETAFPIRNNYEISLRLHREMAKGGETFDIPLPRCQGVEREYGWVGVEVPGKLQLDEQSRNQVQPVDVRQLPPEMVRSAVSPILKAYRYHTPAAAVRLVAVRLPEKEPASGSVDQIRATTQLSAEGNLQTDLRITLRNRLRHSLNLNPPPDTEVLSATLDGQPVKPSKDEKGRIVLPLKRSSGQDRLQPFTLQVFLRGKVPVLGWFGHPHLALPAVDLPVSSLVWNVYLPANNLYSLLQGDIEPQFHVGRGSWHQAPSRSFTAPAGLSPFNPVQLEGSGAAGASDTGAMPVRLSVEESGTRLEYSRYWIEKDHPIEVWFYYLRSWLRIPAWLSLAALLGLGLLLSTSGWGAGARRISPWAGGAVCLAVLWPLYWAGGILALVLGLFLGIAAIAYQRGWLRKAPLAVAEWGRSLWPRFKQRPKGQKPLTLPKILWKIALAVGLAIFGVMILSALLQVLLQFLYQGGPFLGGGSLGAAGM